MSVVSGLPRRRRVAGAVLALVAVPLLTLVFTALRHSLSLSSVLLLYLLVVVVVATIGGALVGIITAVACVLCANYWFTEPFHTLRVTGNDEVVALVVFICVAGVTSALVEISARRRASAVTLDRIASVPVQETTVAGVLEEVRRLFGFHTVALVELPGADAAPVTIALVGAAPDGAAAELVDAGPGFRLDAWGPQALGRDRRLLRSLATAAARAREAEQLAAEAGRATELAEIDRVRSALLAAVGHDLRTPLAGIKAAASSLRQSDVEWTVDQRAELLATIEESTDHLTAVVDNLLDLTRLRAGVLSVHVEPTAVDAVVAAAILHGTGNRVVVDVPDDLPLAAADAGLLERAVANLLDNARRHSPYGEPPVVRALATEDTVRLDVVDRGPGIPAADRDRVFVAFQRLDDRSNVTGLGLGLAIARGFVEAMGGTLEPGDTPGGGLTMTVALRRAT